MSRPKAHCIPLAGCLAILTLLLIHNPAGAATIHPYLQSPTESSIWVCWSAATLGMPEVRYGTDLTLSESATGAAEIVGGLINWHSVHLQDLEPNTLYFYQCRSGREESEVLFFRTPPSPGWREGHLRFGWVSDTQEIPDQARATMNALRVRARELYPGALGEEVSLLINSGDLSYAGSNIATLNNEFVQSVTELSGEMPVMITLGNHEEDSPNYYQLVHYDEFAGPRGEAYYAFRWGPVLFLMINSISPYSEVLQLEWLKGLLDQASQDETIDWVFAFCHYPPWSEAWPADNSGWVADHLLPVLAAYPKVELLGYGHSHTYARGALAETPLRLVMQSSSTWLARWREITPQIDYPQIQKTFDQITYTLFDFDLEMRSYTARTYSRGNADLPLDNVLIDSFGTARQQPPPAAPRLVTPAGALALPAELVADEIDGPSPLHSSHFQITPAAGDYSHPIVDIRRDVENWYFDTGAPDWQPVDRNAGVDIRRLMVTTELLPEPHTWFWRVRYRDQNLQWSGWSEERSFTTSNDGRAEIRGSNHSLHLDGIQGYAELAAGTSTLPAGALTVEAWVRVNQLPSLAAAIGAVEWTGGVQKGWYLGCSASALTFALASRGADDGDGVITQLSSKNIKAGEWYHIAGTWDGTVMNFYFEGKLAKSNATQQRGEILYDPGSIFSLGAYVDGNETHLFNGEIDEVRLWDTALSAAEIQSWMHQTLTPAHPSWDHLVSYYPMENTIAINRFRDARGRHDGFVHGINISAVAASTAPLGTSSVFITSNQPFRMGAPGAALQVQVTSVPHERHYLAAWTDGAKPLDTIDWESFPAGVTRRIGPLWGVKEYGYGVILGQNISADLHFDLAALQASCDAGALLLLRRTSPELPWEEITSMASRDSLGFVLTGAANLHHEYGIGVAAGCVGVTERPQALQPRQTGLQCGYPNPFNPATQLHFYLRRNDRVRLEICNLRGQSVRTLWQGELTAGEHHLSWDGRDEEGSPCSSGIYFARLVTSEVHSQIKLTLMR